MTKNEIALYDSVIPCSRRYVEFGTGGSTCRAALTKKDWIIAVDSSADWLAKVSKHCRSARLIHADIGKVGDWGIPVDEKRRSDWPSYHERIWHESIAAEGDLFFIDGRFRVACFIQALLRAKQPDAVFAIHDFSDRPHYHVVLPFVREVAVAERLSVFVRRRDFDEDAAAAILETHRYDWK